MGDRRSGSADKRWTGWKLQQWRRRILESEPLCRHCAQKNVVTAAQEVDHIIPLENDGTYADENACPLCVACHREKTAKDRGYRKKPTIGSDGWPR